MKRFIQNFTTIEQSRRLLKLGLKADSADCVIASYQGITYLGIIKHSILCYNFSSYGEFVKKVGNAAALAAIHPNEEYIPCWSVGRLIEIYFICTFQPEILIDYTIDDLVDYLLGLFENTAMDFTKLLED